MNKFTTQAVRKAVNLNQQLIMNLGGKIIVVVGKRSIQLDHVVFWEPNQYNQTLVHTIKGPVVVPMLYEEFIIGLAEAANNIGK